MQIPKHLVVALLAEIQFVQCGLIPLLTPDLLGDEDDIKMTDAVKLDGGADADSRTRTGLGRGLNKEEEKYVYPSLRSLNRYLGRRQVPPVAPISETMIVSTATVLPVEVTTAGIPLESSCMGLKEGEVSSDKVLLTVSTVTVLPLQITEPSRIVPAEVTTKPLSRSTTRTSSEGYFDRIDKLETGSSEGIADHEGFAKQATSTAAPTRTFAIDNGNILVNSGAKAGSIQATEVPLRYTASAEPSIVTMSALGKIRVEGGNGIPSIGGGVVSITSNLTNPAVTGSVLEDTASELSTAKATAPLSAVEGTVIPSTTIPLSDAATKERITITLSTTVTVTYSPDVAAYSTATASVAQLSVDAQSTTAYVLPSPNSRAEPFPSSETSIESGSGLPQTGLPGIYLTNPAPYANTAASTSDSELSDDGTFQTVTPILNSTDDSGINDKARIQSFAATKRYAFNPVSSTNVAVYYGQTPATAQYSLLSQCSQSSVDIVVLAFITSKTPENKVAYDFGLGCSHTTPSACTKLASDIRTCQRTYGKKILVGIGGATGTVTFGNDVEAKTFGNAVWYTFGRSTLKNIVRPFGNVIVDGFDFDNESAKPTSYLTFANSIRSHFPTQTGSRKYYLSAAPQCPFPDASDPMDMLLTLDFVFVQFYNNPSCEIGTAGFQDSVKTWSTALGQGRGKMFIGAPSWPPAGPTTYNGGIKSAKGIMAVVASVKGKFPNLGGVMFWDGPEGSANVEGGRSILGWAKSALRS